MRHRPVYAIEILELRVAPAAIIELTVSNLNGMDGFRISGERMDDLSGRSVSGVGDVNGDGLDDLLIGAVGADNASGQSTGAAYVLFGTIAGFAPNISLSSLDGSNGFKIVGNVAFDSIGWAVGAAGDVNGDGFRDLLIGAPDADPNAVLSGATYVVFGKGTPFPRELNLSGLNGANGFRLSGQAFPDQSGRAVSGAGDINGDGFDDLLVGAMYVDANGVNSGASYVVFGKQFGFTANINLATLNGIDGFKISGASSNDYAGRSVGTAGDINGDGFDDLVVGAHFADANGSGSGAAYVILGKANGFPTNINVSALDGVNGFTIAGANSGEGAGISVGTAGDVNGDGLDDLLVGAFAAFRNGLRFNGAGYVVFGNANGFPANFTLSTVNGSNGFQVTGAASYDSLGYSSSKAGDVNGDGFDDVIISATGADSNGVTASGASYVIFGKAAGFAPTFSVSTLNGIDGFTLKGVGTYDSFGLSVSGAGDLNGDGIDDVVIGAPRTDFGRTMSGASYVVFGRSVTSVSVNDAAVEEDDAGSRVLTFTATLSEAATELLTLHYSTENRTAQAGSDFTGVVNQSLIFEPGDLSKTIAVTISGDTTHELDETFAVVFSPQAGVRFLDEIASGTISNDDASPIVSVGDGKIVEGNSGITALAFPIALSAFSGLPVAVQYVTADGTALAGRDYSGISAGMVEFAPGETAKTITVDVVGETLFENDEIFSIVLSVATGAVIGGATGTGTIQNEDVMPRMSIAGGLLVEGASGMGELTFTAALSAPSGLPATVQVAGANETAKAGSDFIPLISHALTFAPGETAKTITVQVFGDVLYEDDETFSVALSGAIGAVIEDGSAIGTIRNDDDAPLVTIAGGSLGEGDSGTSTLTFLAALSAPSGLPATVQIASADGTAFAGTDFIALTPQVLNFAPGETIKTISVEVLGETIYERDETFAVLLSGATGVGIDDGIALGTIQNDDTAPLMSIADGSLIEGNSGTSNLTFTAALSAPSGLPATVQIASGDGTALAGTDFIVLTPQVLTFAPGETIKTISIDVFGDTSIENHRHFSVTLSDAGGATIQRGTAIGTILNDDTALLISDSPSNREGHTGSVAFPFDVTLVQASALPVTVRFATVDASASGGSDFIPWASGGEITFVPGETQKTIAVDVLGDADSETHEQFSVILSEPINAPLMRAIGTATILNDDALVQIGEESLLEGHAGSRTLSFTVSIRNETVLAVRVNVAAVDGTAAAGSDYALLGPGILEFAPGEVGKTVVVDVLGDLIVESNETFSLRLSDPVNAVIADEQGVATILDDDVTLAGPRKATFTDVDGENVTIKVSKGTLKVEDFTIFPSGFGAQLALIDFSGESEFAGADLTITSKAPRGVASGDRVAHVGHIDAAGIDLGKVRISGVIGQIDAGDALTPKRGIASLSAQSIGRSGLLTQLPGGSLQSDIDGALKTLRLADGIHDASLVVNGSIGTIDITGGVIGSAIRSEEAIGTIRISGDFAADATITARGRLDPASSSHSVAIGSIAIGGSVEDAQILAGYDLTGAAVNADVGIGTVRVRGNWIASDLVAGAIAGADARIGTDDDEPIFRDDAILSKIASVVIKGEVLGSDNGADHFGFVAEEIAAFKVAGNKLAFTPGARNDLAGLPLGPNADVRIREVA